ncbi:nuclear transport factor 2 family protein [Sphingomonas japonica]|uniref:Ketosteroid isomerase-like protein n=1 Tax=Sphingomonas japonica TaxID=511662 RepID=A0ABX0U000_9SPHN|nr:nuclear transport factor 2 family protein [Sphingomonas japonica]NIJ23900.1 ketosteroid isomerase-like protein [Sphingomonas japonica]
MLTALTLVLPGAIGWFPSVPIVGQVVPDGAQDRAADEAIIRQRAAAWGAAFTRGDVSAVESLLADDFVGTAKDGTLYDKQAMLGWVRAGPNLTSSTTHVNRLRFYGDIAIATGTDEMVGPPPALKPIKTVWTDIWIHRDGEWRVVAAHDMAGVPTGH